MESFAKYILNNSDLKDRVFISNPPSAALLIWTNKQTLPGITGISLVEMENTSLQSGVSTVDLNNALTNRLYGTVPISHIVYDKDLNYMRINGSQMPVSDAAVEISREFNIRLGDNPAKIPNDITQINDPFHIWSRGAFDGRSVMKTDVDVLTLNMDLKTIKSLIEIKRSRKIPVGTWKPFINPRSSHNDCNNYFIMITLANLLDFYYYTIHHDIMDGEISFKEGDLVDLFTYKPDSTSPVNQATLNTFSAEENRRVVEIDKLL